MSKVMSDRIEEADIEEIIFAFLHDELPSDLVATAESKRISEAIKDYLKGS